MSAPNIQGAPRSRYAVAEMMREAASARSMRRALSAIANASAGDYLPGEDALSYWQRFAYELQAEALRALNEEG